MPHTFVVRLEAMRFHSTAYIHGHQVGGTNPSLVEALGAGNAVIAHDNRFNRWVAGEGAVYFDSAESLSALMRELLSSAMALENLRRLGELRFVSAFTWPSILEQYERLLERFLPTASESGSLLSKT